MFRLVICVALVLAFTATAPMARARSEALDVTVTYRERIALPPDAALDVQLFDASAGTAGRIASRRVAVTGVPMTMSLAYDPRLVEDGSRYAVVATLLSAGEAVFRATEWIDGLAADRPDPVDILLTRLPAGDHAAALRGVSGVRWVVTEIMGEAWSTDHPATLSVNADMRFSLFGGCNQFAGQLLLADGSIAFPQNFAGTLKACPDHIEALERRMLDALLRASGYVRYGAGLVLMDVAGRPLVHFEERPE